MTNMEYQDRRKFIKEVTAGAMVMPFTGLRGLGSRTFKSEGYPIFFFTKPLDGLELEEMSGVLADSGVDGFDLSVRPGGRVVPERVKEDLPKVVEMGKKYGLKTEMMVTAITEAEASYSEEILKTAHDVGIRHYRLGYYDYDFDLGVVGSLSQIKKKMDKVLVLNEEIGIQGGYQNHTGIRFGAPLWDIWEVIKDYPREAVSCQFDVCHAVTEGSASWVLALRLMKDHIGSLALKDFRWEMIGGKAKRMSTPLGEGIVDFDRFFGLIKELDIVAPFTLHVEYPILKEEEKDLGKIRRRELTVSRIKKDVEFIRVFKKKYNLI